MRHTHHQEGEGAYRADLRVTHNALFNGLEYMGESSVLMSVDTSTITAICRLSWAGLWAKVFCIYCLLILTKAL